jgi:micrococcal nuclease
MRALFFGLLLLVTTTSFGQLSGRVIDLADGDTFTLLTSSKKKVKVRLYGIDCPEGKQDFGHDAKKFLSDLIFNKEISVKEMDIDRYGRTIGIVHVETVNVNERMLSAGMAWHYKKYDKNKTWDALEVKARKDKKGLWKNSKALAPWVYRQSKRDAH